jgi:hypothetical protein
MGGDLSDEALRDRWVENPYVQYFCGEEFFGGVQNLSHFRFG